MTSTSTPGSQGPLTPGGQQLLSAGSTSEPHPNSLANMLPSSLSTSMTAKLATELNRVEDVLDRAVTQASTFADETSHHLMRAGGKRVRPMLVLVCSHLGSGPSERVYTAGAAVELVHLASLYHDDVMDEAPMRRGTLSAQQKWGNNVAILTGDILFARASTLSLEVSVEAMALQAQTFERLVLGQLHEFIGPQDGEDPIEHYLSVLSDKTGSLISAACQFGLIASDAPRELRPIMREYGEAVGIAFQLADDVIDLTSDGATSGKTPGTDLREGVATLPVLLARKAASDGEESAAEVVAKIEGDLTSDAALDEARRALAGHHALTQTREQARVWADTAVKALDPLPDGEVKEHLSAFAYGVVDRVG